MGVELHANPAAVAFGGSSYGATTRVMGCAEMRVELHANLAAGAFGGAPHGATNRVRITPR
eukprot:3563079-Pyramimonas_sp.AAC.1